MSAHAEIIAGRDPETGRFLAGNGGGGRAKGSRNKLGEQFIDDLHAAWAKHGDEVIERVVKEKPEQFLKVIASTIPQEVRMKVEQDDGRSFDEIIAECRRIAGSLAARGIVLGAGAPVGSQVGDDQPLLAANGDAGAEGRDPSVGKGEVR